MSKIKLALGVLLVGGATVAVGKCIYDKVVENRKANEDANDEMFSDESINEICNEVVQAMKDVGEEYNKKLKETFDNLRNAIKETDDEAVATVDAVVTEAEKKVDENIPEDNDDGINNIDGSISILKEYQENDESSGGINNESPDEKTEEESFTKAVDDAKAAFKEVLDEESKQ